MIKSALICLMLWVSVELVIFLSPAAQTRGHDDHFVSVPCALGRASLLVSRAQSKLPTAGPGLSAQDLVSGHAGEQ